MRPLPAVLLDLHEDLSTGKLVLRRGRISKSVDLVNGNPISTTSTPRDETLGHFLVSSGVISEEQHRNAVQRASDLGGKLGEALVAQRVLTVEQLIEQLGKQARHKLVQALRWPQGAWRFDESFDPIEGMQLRMVEVVLGGLRETAVEDLDRLARLDGMGPFELTERGQRLRHELKRTFGEAVVSLLATGAQIGEIERAFGDRAKARIAIDSMIMCDAVGVRVVPVGLGARAPTRPSLDLSTPRTQTREKLFDLLFDDLATPPPIEGAAPIDLSSDQDTGIVSKEELETASDDRDAIAAARQMITAEHNRIQNADHYAVLMVSRRALHDEIDGACSVRTTLLDRDAAPLSEPRDRERVDEIRQAYTAARTTLLDAGKRTLYDRELAGGELVSVAPALDTELGFRVAEEMMARRQWSQAMGHLKTIIARSPGEADYHAALGWCTWMAGHKVQEIADEARQHLNISLAINPDHPASHDYKGRIDAMLHGDDAEALFHLERAIDLDPNRTEAAAMIENLLVQRGELRRWERVLKRLLFRLRGKGNAAEAKAWAKLAKLYFDQLDDPQAGAAAAGNARKIAPRDPEVLALADRADQIRTGQNEPIRAGWREALEDTQTGIALVRSTEASGHADAAFLAASTMVALGTADSMMADLYEAKRPRGALSPTLPLDRDHWAMLRHKDDGLELGALVELVAPAVHVLAPMTLADSELDASQRIEDGELPTAFAKMRARYAGLLGVHPPAVYHKVELGSQIHVVASNPPVLVAGDDALTAPERPDLVFRLARAMTFLWPGRAVGASRPGRVLRAIVLAIFREASGSPVGAEEPLAPAAAEAAAALSEEIRAQARAAALRMLSRGGGLNLSVWARSLSRTADRAGMLFSGDVPAAFAGAKEVGELDKDLVEFAYSAAHVHLRNQLGLARG